MAHANFLAYYAYYDGFRAIIFDGLDPLEEIEPKFAVPV